MARHAAVPRRLEVAQLAFVLDEHIAVRALDEVVRVDEVGAEGGGRGGAVARDRLLLLGGRLELGGPGRVVPDVVLAGGRHLRTVRNVRVRFRFGGRREVRFRRVGARREAHR